MSTAQQLQEARELYRQGLLEEAEEVCIGILADEPEHPEALAQLGHILVSLGRPEEALDALDQSLLFRPDDAEALNSRGNALREMGRAEEALASYDDAIAIRPDYPEAFSNRGNALKNLGRLDEALESYDRALELRPDYPNALSNRGTALNELARLDEALASYDAALALKPDHHVALNNRGNTLLALKKPGEAILSYDQALAVRPNYAEAWANRGEALLFVKRTGEAFTSFEKALAIRPDASVGGIAKAALHCCDWKRMAELGPRLAREVRTPRSGVQPFVLIGYDCSAEMQFVCAKNFVRRQVRRVDQPLWDGEAYQHNRIRIAYLSADFQQHATACLMAGLFETHDRSRFEVTAISYGEDDESDMRMRLVEAFEHFEDVSHKTDAEIAHLIRDLEIDIAVDLKGHTENARPGILAHRPAPVQVSYLGYPGTMGADFMDYIIADETVLPLDQQDFYSEQIVHLPGCYQVNDNSRSIAQRTPTRSEAGLPEEGFVLCSFNNTYKITPEVFDIWMNLLKDNPGSVLWLLRDNEAARRNLLREAAHRGVPSDRLVFAERAVHDQHLARHRLADLFLDTVPCNAHTTASDALWAGLPLLTCLGDRFQGRVAASLLKAVGLPELAATNLAEYEAMARKLMRDPALLAGFRQRLAENRLTHPLFDTTRFTRDIEAVYTRLHRQQVERQ